MFERVQQRLQTNQQGAARNNRNPQNFLLRGGYIKCSYCGGNMTTGRIGGSDKPLYGYICTTSNYLDNRCTEGGNRITGHIADSPILPSSHLPLSSASPDEQYTQNHSSSGGI